MQFNGVNNKLMGNPWRRGWISCKVKLLKWSRTLNSMLRQLQKTLTTISGLGYIQLHIFSLLQTDKSHCKITIDTNQFSLKSFKPKICFYIRNIFQFKVNYGNFFSLQSCSLWQDRWTPKSNRRLSESSKFGPKLWKGIWTNGVS